MHMLFEGTPYLHAPIRNVSLLGSPVRTDWKQTPNGSVIHLPAAKPNKIAYAFKISLATK